MDSFELNKIAGAVLFAVLVSFGLSILSETLFKTEAPELPGYAIAVAEPAEGEGAAEAGTAEAQPIGLLLASADAGAGEASAKKCGACHSFGEGEANKVGPNLYGVVNRPVAGHEGYEYSEAMRAHAQEEPAWTFEALNAFLLDPKGDVPGTKMAFAGLKNDPERGNVIAYLRSLAAEPAPLPEAEAVTAEAPAEGAAPADAGSGATAAAEPTAPAPTEGEPVAPAETPAAAEAGETSGAQPAPEVSGEGGLGGGAATQPQGSLGAIDSVPADQQGGVPQVAPVEQPAPEPSGDEPAPATTPAAPPAAGAAQSEPAEAPQSPAEAPVPDPAPAPAGQGAAVEPAPAAPPAGTGSATPPPDAAGDLGQPAQPAVAQTSPEAAPAPADGAAAPAPAGTAAAPAEPTPAPAAPAAASAPAPAPGGAFATAVAAADAAKGQGLAKRCAACHSFEKDAPNKVGPKLWDVVNRPVASVPDYAYSEAMKAHAEGGAKSWTYDELSAYLENPKGHVPGNKMAFPGLKKPDDRANVVAYLRSLSDNPAPAP